MDSTSSHKVADIAINLVEAVTSSVGNSQLKLQNTTNQHLADLKTTLESLKKGSDSNSEALLKAIDDLKSESKDLKSETKAAREEGKALRDALEKSDKARRIEFALQNLDLVSDFRFYSATERKDS